MKHIGDSRSLSDRIVENEFGLSVNRDCQPEEGFDYTFQLTRERGSRKYEVFTSLYFGEMSEVKSAPVEPKYHYRTEQPSLSMLLTIEPGQMALGPSHLQLEQERELQDQRETNYRNLKLFAKMIGIVEASGLKAKFPDYRVEDSEIIQATGLHGFRLPAGAGFSGKELDYETEPIAVYTVGSLKREIERHDTNVRMIQEVRRQK